MRHDHNPQCSTCKRLEDRHGNRIGVRCYIHQHFGRHNNEAQPQPSTSQGSPYSQSHTSRHSSYSQTPSRSSYYPSPAYTPGYQTPTRSHDHYTQSNLGHSQGGPSNNKPSSTRHRDDYGTRFSSQPLRSAAPMPDLRWEDVESPEMLRHQSEAARLQREENQREEEQRRREEDNDKQRRR